MGANDLGIKWNVFEVPPSYNYRNVYTIPPENENVTNGVY